MNRTELWVKEDEKRIWRLLCTVNFGSTFRTMDWWSKANGEDLDNQLRAAREQRDGWKQNGPWPNAQFRIYQNDELVEGY